MDFLFRNWALAASSVLALAIGLFVLFRLYEASPRGRLAVHGQELRKLKARQKAADSVLERAERRLAALRDDPENTRPRVLGEAEEAVQDARSMQQIIADQILRAKKQARDVILEEFTPKRQDELRKKYL